MKFYKVNTTFFPRAKSLGQIERMTQRESRVTVFIQFFLVFSPVYSESSAFRVCFVVSVINLIRGKYERRDIHKLREWLPMQSNV